MSNSNTGAGCFGIVVILFIALLIITLGPRGCTDEQTARRVLEQNGYTDIRITGWRPFMKNKDDTFSTGFCAKSPSGQIVTGAVTSGWLKGATIRFD